MDGKTYGALRLPRESLNDFQYVKIAMEVNYGKIFSSEKVLSQLIAALEDGDPAVYETYCKLKLKNEK